MSTPAFSIIVISRERPGLLRLCLGSLFQIRYPNFEIVVVADPAGLDAIAGAGFAARVKTVPFDGQNVSIARNLGLAQAGGDIIAFIDDDSVAEPGWLYHLARAFDDETVAGATGYVRGRNGIGFQVQAESIDRNASVTPIPHGGLETFVPDLPPGQAVSTIGTNCAFRARVFAELGSFDPGFAYFLDESDLNLRMAGAGMKTAVVPLAQVHHRAAASRYRDEKRRPRSLFQIGRSTALFLRKHAAPADVRPALQRALGEQKRRLILNAGLGARKSERLLNTMRQGIREGMSASLENIGKPDRAGAGFLKLSRENAIEKHRLVHGYRINGRALRARARALVEAGHVVSLFLFSRTALFHRVRFHPDGYWEQTGGLFGRSAPDQPLFRVNSLTIRVEREYRRFSRARAPWDVET